VLDVAGRSIDQILGYPDDLKFRSSMTLFAAAVEAQDLEQDLFQEALRKYFDGKPDSLTLGML